jgi:hypothetical protein
MAAWPETNVECRRSQNRRRTGMRYTAIATTVMPCGEGLRAKSEVPEAPKADRKAKHEATALLKEDASKHARRCNKCLALGKK